MPVILLTASGGLCDRVAGLDAGADGHLIRAFTREELDARILAPSHRKPQSNAGAVQCGKIRYDRIGRMLQTSGQDVPLNRKKLAAFQY